MNDMDEQAENSFVEPTEAYHESSKSEAGDDASKRKTVEQSEEDRHREKKKKHKSRSRSPKDRERSIRKSGLVREKTESAHVAKTERSAAETEIVKNITEIEEAIEITIAIGTAEVIVIGKMVVIETGAENETRKRR